MSVVVIKKPWLTRPPFGQGNVDPAKASRLVGLWQFNEGAGTVSFDTSVNSNVGDINGATWIDTELGRCLSFDGGTQHVDLGALDLNLEADMTVFALVRPSAWGNDGTIVRQGSAGTGSWGLDINNATEWRFFREGSPDRQAVSSISGDSLDEWYLVFGIVKDNVVTLEVNGVVRATTAAATTLDSVAGNVISIGQEPNNTDRFAGAVALVGIYSSALGQSARAQITANINSLYLPKTTFALNLTAITSSGTLSSQAATVVGNSTRELTATGLLLAQAATVSGTAARELTSTGNLISGPASIAGISSRELTSSGTLVSEAALLSGVAARELTATGSLLSGSAAIAGVATRELTSTGTLTSQASITAGTSAVGSVHASSGALSSQAATCAGTSIRELTSTGTLSSQLATVVGVVARELTTSGSLLSEPATVSGNSVRELATGGTLASESAIVVGTSTVSSTVTATGTLISTAATVVGVADRIITSVGGLVSASAGIVGTSEVAANSTGVLISAEATVAGLVFVGSGTVSIGSLLSASGSILGVSFITPGSGPLPETLNSTINLNLTNSPQIEDVGTYEAILAIHSACELLLREHEATKVELQIRIEALEAQLAP